MLNEWILGFNLFCDIQATFNFLVFLDVTTHTKNYFFNIPIFFFLQIFFLVCLSVWARAAGPRFRVDQIFTITWKEFLIILAGYLVFFCVYIILNMLLSIFALNKLFFSNSGIFIVNNKSNFYSNLLIPSNLVNLYINFFFFNTWVRPLVLSDCSALNYPFQNLNPNQNLVSYFLYSLKQNYNFHVVSFTNNKSPLTSLKNIFSNINWPERELLEMFGIYLKNKLDNRHLLLDYYFIGFPLLRSFTLSGLKQIEHDIFSKGLIYVLISLWTGLKKC